MILQFHIHYKTSVHAVIAIEYKLKEGQYRTMHMQSHDGENWLISIEWDKPVLEYTYLHIDDTSSVMREWGHPRSLKFERKEKYYYIHDFWKSRENIHHAFLTSAFTEAIFSRKTTKSNKKISQVSNSHVLEMFIDVTLPAHLNLGVIGNTESLGKWLKPIAMMSTNYPTWKISLPVDSFDISIQYKYVILDKKMNVLDWEAGDNRQFKPILPDDEGYTCIIHDQDYRFSKPWKGAGMAIPIFSLRSENGFGIGEFSDLIPLAGWAESVSLKIIQVLPVNDTIANKTWQDSYPYAAISVFALHPMYVNIEKIGTFKDKTTARQYQEDKIRLNKLDQVDFEQVMEKKWFYLKVMYDEVKKDMTNNASYKVFKNENQGWLFPYAYFCVLRDEYGTCRYEEWPEYMDFNARELDKKYKTDLIFRDKTDFYIFIQFHAHQQLTNARDFARSKGIALKGDLPIGIYRHSCDAWVAPQLYNMDEQAGAPPDDFSELGQNWGFPTYNWQEMSKDGFSWWKERMKKLNEYFDVLRIDHILGFFRIWQIPGNQISGTMGLFNPRLPFSKDEIIRSGLTGPIERYTKPFLTEELLEHHLSDIKGCIETFFDKKDTGMYDFKSSFPDQKAIRDFISLHPAFMEKEAILLKLFTEVIFIREELNGQHYYNPRITVHTTYSFTCLQEEQKRIVQQLYNHYYFSRHDEFWKKQALWKLPALLDASNMLICGEDLGMIPNSVPDVMRFMNIMSLEIQRMPKGSGRFGHVNQYPYFSVSSPSSHDMPTIRGWWEKDHEMAKEFYYQYIHGQGYTPMKCEPGIVQFIIEDHLAGPSMLAIFPLQDLVGMDADIRRIDADAEQINEPSNPKHYWRFRFHIPVEALTTRTSFNLKLRALVERYRPS